MSLDLHIHSTYSDGTMSPTELVVLAKNKGLTAISITDHDTVDGVNEAISAGAVHGVEVLTGLEVSVEHKGQYMHILGYSFDHENQNLLRGLKLVQEARAKRNTDILERLGGLGITISSNDLQDFSKIGQTGRPHIAQAMVRAGAVKNIDEAFRKYLRRDAPAYVPRFVHSAQDAIQLICNAGGIAVLAHPAIIDYSLKSLPPLLDDLTALGLSGVEVYYPTHSAKIKKQLRRYAEQYNLVLTGGSDYHGDIREGTSLAGGKKCHVPDELLGKMKERIDLVTN